MSDNNDLSSSSNENNVSKKTRRNKKIYYANDRDNIINSLINIIKFDESNCVLLVQLHDNEELINKLNSLTNDIKKYYRCSTWGFFVSINNGKKGDEITLLRSIFKDHGYNIYSKDVITDYFGTKKRYTKLFFNK